jgi:REP element-mobilizing transposase RayT
MVSLRRKRLDGSSAYNKIGGAKRPVNRHLEKSDSGNLKNSPMSFDAIRRKHVEAAIREVCAVRGIVLIAINVRTNHVHIVIATNRLPEPIMNSFKAYATRRLREKGLVGSEEKVWSRHGSTRYLWTEEHIGTAVEYVVSGQGGELPRFD